MSRLSHPSMNLRLGMLLRKTQRRLWIAFAMAMALHSLLSQVDGLRSQRTAARPLTTRFVKRTPRLTKPLEMRKEPKRRHRQIQRPMVSVAPKEIGTSRFGGAELGSEIVPEIIGGTRKSDQRADIALEMMDLETLDAARYEATAVRSSREPDQKIDMRLEMLDIEVLDTGRYKAVVVVNPSDKRDIRGFVYLAFVCSAMRYANWWRPYPDVYPSRGLIGLAQFMDTYTDVRTHCQGMLIFSAPEMLRLPWILICPYYGVSYGTHYELTRNEAAILGRYLLTGGFVFGDCRVIVTSYGSSGYAQDYPSLVNILTEALTTQGLQEGRDWQIENLPSTHPVLHSYYDFDRPPPGYEAYHRCYYRRYDRSDYVVPQPCRFIHYEGRTLGIISTRQYVTAWQWTRPKIKAWEGLPSPLDPIRDLRFGVNTIIFALTQEGSITKQVMDMVEGY